MVVSVSLLTLQSSGPPLPTEVSRHLLGPDEGFKELCIAVWCCSCCSDNHADIFYSDLLLPPRRQKNTEAFPKIEKWTGDLSCQAYIQLVEVQDSSALWSNRKVIPVCGHNKIMRWDKVSSLQRESLPLPFDWYLLSETDLHQSKWANACCMR